MYVICVYLFYNLQIYVFTFIFRDYSHLGWIELYRSVRHINADLYLYRLRHGLAEKMPLKLTDTSLATDKVNYKK